MEILAKFVCRESHPMEGEQHEVIFSAVMDGSDENKSFSRWTPVADLKMIISNETPAATFFEPGKEYYLRFSEKI